MKRLFPKAFLFLAGLCCCAAVSAQDTYVLVAGGSLTNTLKTEQIITDEASLRSFYAVDDLGASTVSAYVVSTPTKAAIGHWNNLAASLFDFAPDASLTFTNPINDYLTAETVLLNGYDYNSLIK